MVYCRSSCPIHSGSSVLSEEHSCLLSWRFWPLGSVRAGSVHNLRELRVIQLGFPLSVAASGSGGGCLFRQFHSSGLSQEAGNEVPPVGSERSMGFPVR